jgi:hypothetical protein
MVECGDENNAESMWKDLKGMSTEWWSQNPYRPGDAEARRAQYLLDCGMLSLDYLQSSLLLAIAERNRAATRALDAVWGKLLYRNTDIQGAVEKFSESVRMARESGIIDADAETRLALARHRVDELPYSVGEAERLAQLRKPAHLPLAELWQSIGDVERARTHARAAFRHACADGGKYVRKYRLREAAELLAALQEEAPPPDDSVSGDSRFPLERDVREAIDRIRSWRSFRRPNSLR